MSSRKIATSKNVNLLNVRLDVALDTITDISKDAAWDTVKIVAILFFVHDNVAILALMASLIAVTLIIKIVRRYSAQLATRLAKREENTASWQAFQNDTLAKMAHSHKCQTAENN